MAHKFRKRVGAVDFKTIVFLLVLAFIAGASLPFVMPEEYSTAGFAVLDSGAKVSENNIQVFLCPQDECALQLESFYGTAQSKIHVMVYSFTKQEIADALVAAKNKGIEVQVLMDKGQAGLKDAKDEFLESKGIELKRADLSGYHIMHNKVSIIDGKAFSTGSFNYTENADSGNAENLLVIKDQKLAERFEQEFQKYWSSS